MWRGWRRKGLLKKYIKKCAGKYSVSRPRKILIDTMKDCLRKRGLDVKQARRMVQGRSVWWEFVRSNAWGVALEMNSWS